MSKNLVELWESAARAFDTRFRLIGDEHGSLPTPCPELDVASLIDHAVGTQISFGRLLGGSADDGSSWPEARAAMAAALVDLDPETSAEHPAFGAISHGELLTIATNDMLIHSWDLARAIGADETLPEENLQPAIDGLQSFPPAVRAAVFADPVEVGDDATMQQKMLAVAGRKS